MRPPKTMIGGAIMSKDRDSRQQLDIRSRSYEHDPTSNERWFEIWVKIAKKELLEHYKNFPDKKD